MGQSYSAAVVVTVGLVAVAAIAGSLSRSHEISAPSVLLAPHGQIVSHHMLAPRLEHVIAQRLLAAP